MSGRTFAVIFFFWAFLTILTPTLILLSKSSKPDLHSVVDRNEGMENAGRMQIGYTEKRLARTLEKPPAPALVQHEEQIQRERWPNFRRIFKK